MALLRAYSTLAIKSIDEDARILTGIASTPELDRQDDIVDPHGATFTLPLPFLYQHRANEPIGQVIAADVSDAGITVKVQIAKGLDIPRIDEAWALIKARLVRGLSLGLLPIEVADVKNSFTRKILKWEWLELSAVTIPANQSANIQTIKAFDLGCPAASGTDVVMSSPGVTGTRRVIHAQEPVRMKTIADQIKSFEATRQAKAARMAEIMNASAEAGATLDEAQSQEYDTLKQEVKGVDDHLVRLAELDAVNKAAARPVTGDSPAAGTASRAPSIVTLKQELPKGIAFARYAMCIAASRGVHGEAIRLAKEHYPEDAGVHAMIAKAAVTGGSTSGSHYIDDMIPYNVMNDFIEFLRAGSIIGKFGGPIPGSTGTYPSLRRVGFNERVSGISTGYSAAWKGEGLPVLPAAAVTFNTTLTWNTMSALAVMTKEALRFSNPRAEAQVRDDLARAVNAKLDLDFIDPAKAASTTTSPASITNAVAATSVSGTAAVNVRHDLAVLLGKFATNKLDPMDLVIIMSATIAAQVSMMVNTLGQADFPSLTMAGGYLAGIPVIVSEHLTAVGSPSTQTIVMVKASDVYLADDGEVTVEASDQASVEMQDSSSVSAITGTGASLVSLWQTGAVGLMANRVITWKKRRSTAVEYLSPVAYAVPTS